MTKPTETTLETLKSFLERCECEMRYAEWGDREAMSEDDNEQRYELYKAVEKAVGSFKNA